VLALDISELQAGDDIVEQRTEDRVVSQFEFSVKY
jgi:hypothetical protein